MKCECNTGRRQFLGNTLKGLAAAYGTYPLLCSTVALNDGDQIQLGTVDLTVRLWATDRLPETKRIGRRIT